MTDKDIQFLEKKTNLTKDQVLLLCEEERDFNLLLEQISSFKLTKKDLSLLSFKFYVKLIIFAATANTGFDIHEKSIVASMIEDLFPKMNNRTNFSPFIKRITSTPNEAGAKYFFIIATLFNDKVNCKDSESDQIKYISSGLAAHPSDLHKHIAEWFVILKELKSSNKFRVSIMDDSFSNMESVPRISPEARNLLNGNKK